MNWPVQKTWQVPVPAPVQHPNGVPAPVHAALVQFPVPAPVQQLDGVPGPVHAALVGRLPARLDVPVVSGFRLIGMFPMNCAQEPPGQSPLIMHTLLLFVPR
jgi:hypothetical protein